MNEAVRKKHLMGEVVSWRILEESDFDYDGIFVEAPIPSGVVDVGRVLVANRWGGSWTMSVDEFDAEYKAR